MVQLLFIFCDKFLRSDAGSGNARGFLLEPEHIRAFLL